ncbi:hypothetical protein [Paenibacillus sp. A3M_27_13]|uniref:hypothetical protein n=1 Tax=Paenibacillus sp. A3M_27_13 TaxID=2962029 RepID=UPI0020B81323|nr:hypothetical protein [Paenibacillus sp. A3M_27_13]MCP3746795.1 hypothetical protein [Paenibacillus sp. A3M_27_13]
MAQEGTPGEIARIEWYQKEDFKKGRMSKKEEVRYLIRRGYEDATLDRYLASDEEIEKAIQAALVGLRSLL